MLNRLGLLLGACAVACVAFAASESDFALKMEKIADDQVALTASWKVDGLQGWSYGVCHDADKAAIGNCGNKAFGDCAAAATGCPAIACSTDLLTAKAGQPPTYVSINLYEGDAAGKKPGGLTQGVVIDFMQVVSLNATTRFEFMKIKYTLKAASAPVRFCTVLGSPPVDNVFVFNGDSFGPGAVQDVTLGGEIPTCPEAFKMTLSKAAEDKVAVHLDTVQDLAPSGFSLGVADNSEAIIVSKIEPGAAVKALMGGGNPEYWGAAQVAGGGTLGCIFSMGATVKVLPACATNQEIAVVSYINTSGQSATAQVTLSGNLGTPKVPLVIDVDGTSYDVQTGPGVSITVGGGQPPFVRGEVNQDGKLNVSDAVAIARYVFNLGSQKAKIDACKDAADVNDDGSITAADALYLLAYLFTGGAAIPAPAGACGIDPTPDGLDCVQYQCP
ncbi:MAG TPA: dockerin type I repeat-containing protein [Planctomycetota bacterium]|nr:dockerin type I repeat-containing protein [Planctomycetota bacterium]OQC22175.1 MAG: Cellulose 1,4-beta-cellobiosidase precursor [Planctomycetes bacterium ADurb.Bin069]NMD35608.1 hypothetical protein [Planctomycetota bacterium]HNR99739.1 dockerin type I repeat-containing protein [Planctomycetota bacterium]HNU25358.1 dockerin type I repeat-containing protein [Planctomycetota bacterium]